jgi:hypothetical protein
MNEEESESAKAANCKSGPGVTSSNAPPDLDLPVKTSPK